MRSTISKVSLTCSGAGQLSAAEFVASLPRGAYTTARVLQNTNRVFELGRQVDRLVFSCQHFLREAKMNSSNDLALRLSILSVIEQTISQSPLPQQSDCKLTVVINVQAPAEINIHAHLEKMKNRTADNGRLIQVVLSSNLGVSRSNAEAKDSKWVVDREQVVDTEAEETLLLTSDGAAILEGSQTNFFAVLHDGTVVTAEEHILKGTVRAVVLDACQALGIPVLLAPPRVADIPAYKEAFLASTSRLVLPIDAIGSVMLPRERQVTDAIAHWVAKQVDERSISALQLVRI